MKKYFLLFFIGSLLYAQSKTLEQKVDSVLALMTLDEKVGQLVQYSAGWDTGTETRKPKEGHEELVRQGKIGSFLNIVGAEQTRQLQKIAVEESRLKIPLIFGLDVIHGYKTTFPIPLAEACSWNPELVEFSARMQAIETSAAGVHWTFSPMVDIARDPRWGRIMEGSGEDPYLGSVMAAARVKGYQGKNLNDENTILACAKHFAAYGAVEGGKDYNTVDISERTLREIYLPPFKAAVDAGVGSLMSAFNEIGGVPSSANKLLLTQILRNEWQSDAFVLTDWNTIGEFLIHGIANDLKEATKIAIEASIDMDMESNGYHNYLAELVKEGKVDIKYIDDAVRRILKAKFKLGLFDDPYKYCNSEREARVTLSEDLRRASKQVALESVVLLKNENNLLPLNKNIKSIALIGELAASKDDPLGPWAQQGTPETVVSILEGLKNKVGDRIKINYAEGCKVRSNDKSGFKEAIDAVNRSDVAIVVIGETRDMSGEAHSKAMLDLPGVQEELIKEIKKTGKPVVAILMNGRPLTINWISENIPAIIESWYLGCEHGSVIADILFGDYVPCGKLTVTFPKGVGQIPLYYNHKNTGRPYNPENPRFTSYYIDFSLEPLYPFGYGLSYTTFEYSNLKLKTDKVKSDDSVKFSVDVTNTGKYEAKEIVQVYIRDLVASVTRPVKELKDFKKISLKPGETKTVEFELPVDRLKFFDVNMNYLLEPGKFKLMVGPNSKDLLETEFELIN
ncbi:glycoside hydrolase family 3 N-terminal domain-containing protein [Melioribacter sp. OK-6-Me]|uniref:glycoside hydrolase family 3 N-terminal domain-containing protein n=1 Tax=unclassified Melioribacter TaxID=2627329 RepID=UPI003ED98A0C